MCIFFICWFLAFQVFYSEEEDRKSTISDSLHLTKSILLHKRGAENKSSDKVQPLINFTDFEYLINQPSCSKYQHINDEKKKMITVILVHSAPNNTEKRQAIRDTWGQKDSRSRLFFVLGAVNLTSLQNELLLENKQFQDLIQGNFIDTYQNLTYKHIMSLKWFKDNCPEVKFLFRTDDDIIINMQTVYKFMETNVKEDNNTIICNYVDSEYRGKKKLTISEADFYPTNCYGYAIIFSNDVIGRIYREAQIEPYFWIDDKQFSGPLRNISVKSFYSFYEPTNKLVNDLIERKTSIEHITPKYIFIEPNLNVTTIRKLWNNFKENFP